MFRAGIRHGGSCLRCPIYKCCSRRDGTCSSQAQSVGAALIDTAAARTAAGTESDTAAARTAVGTEFGTAASDTAPVVGIEKVETVQADKAQADKAHFVNTAGPDIPAED